MPPAGAFKCYAASMRFIVRCDVEADVILQRRLELRKDGRLFELELGADNRWNILRVTAPVRYPKRFKWGMNRCPSQDQPT